MKSVRIATLFIAISVIASLLSGCFYNDGRSDLRGIWVIKDAAVQGAEASLQDGVYLYMDFQKNGIMLMGSSTGGPFAAYLYRPLAERGKMRLEQKDAEPQTWFFWFEDTHLRLQPDLEGTVTVDEFGVPHEHDHDDDDVDDPPLELIPLQEYLDSLGT